MMRKKIALNAVVLGITAIVISLFLCKWDTSYAEEYDTLEYKTVKSFDDLFEQLETDYTFISIPEDELSGFEKVWQFDIEEPGWIIASTYNHTISTYYFYNNAMFTSLNDYEHCEQVIGGDIYEKRNEDICYVTKGRFYFKLKAEEASSFGTWGDGTLRLRFFFLPASVALKIDKISYNDDYTVATIEFTPMNKKIDRIKLFDKAVKNYNEMHDDGSHCIFFRGVGYSYDYTDTDVVNYEENISDYLTNGFEIKENGTYSIEIEFSGDDYGQYHVAVPFVVDKIGAEAAKIEAKSVKLSKKKATLKVGETTTLKVTFKPKNVTNKTITWSTSNKKVATVDENGKVTAKKKGTCTITATTENGKKAKCKITVKK